MAANPDNITLMPVQFQLAYAPTVTRASTNKTFSIKSLADMIASYPPVDKAVSETMLTQHGLKKGNLELKKMGPIIYFGRYPAEARTRNSDNIEAVTAVVFDFDGRSGDRVDRADFLEACRSHALQVVLHNSYSSEDCYTFRAIFPLKDELATDCYQAAALAIQNLLGMGPGTILPATQGYYFQSRAGGSPDVKAIFGKPVDTVLDFFLLEATADAVAPIGGFQERTTFDPLDHAFNDAEKALYLRCLQIINPYSGDRGHWIKIIGVGLRGWGFTSQILCNPELQNESHKAQLIRLDEWSKAERLPTGATSKYTLGCVFSEGRKLFASGAKMAGLAAIVKLAHDDSPDGLIAEIEDEELKALALRKLDIKPEPAATQATFEELASATTERQAKAEKANTIRERQALAIHNIPACFGRVRDWCVEFASKGELTRHDQLTDDYRFAIDPISAILSVAQLLSVMLGGRVWVGQNHSMFPPTQLNLYVLRIAGSGTGKSVSAAWLKGILGATPHRHAILTNMSFSSGGFWPATFAERGYNVLQLTDEAATLIAPNVGNSGTNLATLRTLLLSAYSAGHEGGELEPPLYSTGGKSNAKSGNNFKPVREPNLNLHIVGTHDVLPVMLTSEFMANGFSARFVVRIEPKVAEETFEDILDRQRRSCFDESDPNFAPGTLNPMLVAQQAFAQHLNQLDSELAAVRRGVALSDLILQAQMNSDDPLTMSCSTYMAANEERQNEPRGNQYIRKNLACGDVAAEAEAFFVPMISDNETLKAIQHREVEKLTKLAAIFTLARSPSAQFIDADVMRYMLEILQLAQSDFIRADRTTDSAIPQRWADHMTGLRKEIMPKGLLYEAGAEGVSTDKLRNASRVWRRLLADLAIADDDLKGVKSQAKQVLHDLGVSRLQVGKAVKFFLTGD